MADYKSLQAAIDAGTANMTAIRNNSRNDSGTDTVATGIDWFYFNSVKATNLYASGNSWIGFGVSSQQLGVNYRDASSMSVWSESGAIGHSKFFKLRWSGYSVWSASDDAYLLQYDVFLIDNGQIFLNYYDVPTSGFSDGVNSLICGSKTITFSVTSGVPCEYTFTPSDSATGTGWSVATGRPAVIVDHKTTGQVLFTVTGITGQIDKSVIAWTEEKPEGTTISVSVSTDGTTFRTVTNGGMFLPAKTYNNQTVYIKVVMTTTVSTATPTLSGIHFCSQTTEDLYKIVLEMDPLQRFESAVGELTVAYSGGTLRGLGGPVADFSNTFVPSELISKPDQNDQEHLEVNMSATSNLMRIFYTDSKYGEHLEVTLSAVGKLTNVSDI